MSTAARASARPRSGARARAALAAWDLPKFAAPRRRPDTVRRSRLNTRLSDALDREVTVVSAPAGYGKSTLAVDWIDESGLPHAWLSLDRQDRDPRVLLGDLVGAVASAFPDALVRFSQQLESAGGSSEASAFVGPYAAAVEADVDDLFVLVLDDFHDLADSPALDVLDLLIRNVPLNMRLVLLTREWDAIPSVARLVSDRRAAALLEDDLAFDQSEAGLLLRRSGVRAAAARRRIAAHAGGWAAALAVLGEHYDPRAPERAAARSAFVLTDFLDREVLSQLAPEELDLLEVCAVLESFDLDLARDVAAAADAPRRLHDLELHTQLIARIGDGGWYRVHGLLAQHLVERLARDAPERLLRLRRSARDACARRDMRRRVIELALDAADWDVAAAEISRVREELYQRGEWSALAGWIDRLPPSSLAGDADLALAGARLAMKLLRSNDGLLRVQQIDAQGLNAAQQARRALYLAVAFRTTGQVSDSLAAFREARTLIADASDESERLAAEIDLEEGVALALSGSSAVARERLETASLAFRRMNDLHRTGEALDALAQTLLHLGRPHDALPAYDEALRFWRTTGDLHHELTTMINLANAQYLLSQLVSARSTLQTVVRRSRALRFQRGEAYGVLNLGVLDHDEGNLRGAAARLAVAQRLADRLGDRLLPLATLRCFGDVKRAHGELGEAIALYRSGLRASIGAGMLLDVAEFQSALGTALVDDGQLDAGAGLLMAALHGAEQASSSPAVALARFRLARVHFARRRRKAALAELQRVYRIAVETGSDERLIAEARQSGDLLEYAAAHRIGDEYFRNMIVRVQQMGESSPPHLRTDEHPRIRAEAFGHGRVAVLGREVTNLEWRSVKSKEMFFLLAHTAHALPKDEIVLKLWPDISPERVNSVFHSTLYRLRHALGADVVARSDEGYFVKGDEYLLDTHQFTEQLRHAVEEENAVLRDRHFLLAVDLYGGGFLAGCDSEWVTRVRRSFEEQFVAALVELANNAQAGSEHALVLELSGRILDVDPVNEAAVALQMRAHSAAGNQALAASALARHVSTLSTEVGVRPSRDLLALARNLDLMTGSHS